MKIRSALLLILLATFLMASAMADEITFSFIAQSPAVSLKADTSGLTMGPALNVLVSDATTGASFSLAGIATADTGAATSFLILPTVVIATYHGSGPNSVLLKDPMGHTIVAGEVDDNASLFSTHPAGAGAFLAGFQVDFVDPAVLALFGLGPGFDRNGGVSVTFGGAQVVGGQLQAVVGGGSITVQTPAAVPEPGTLGLLGSALLAGAFGLRKLKV